MCEYVLRARYESLTAICKVNVAEKQHLSKPIPHLPFPFLWLNSFISPQDTTSPSITLSNVTRIKLSKRPEIDQYATPVLSSSAPGAQRHRNGGRCVCLDASLFSFVICAAVKRVAELKDPSITRAERLEQDLDCVRYIRLFLRASVILIHGTAKWSATRQTRWIWGLH